jgi:hypothetical protein
MSDTLEISVDIFREGCQAYCEEVVVVLLICVHNMCGLKILCGT